MRRMVRSRGEFAGYTIVPLQDYTVREAVRFWRNGHRMALLQKNGNVAISSSGFFDYDGDTHPVSQANVARALVGLKLFPKGWETPFVEAEAARKRELDVASMKNDADRLGYMIVEYDDARTKLPKKHAFRHLTDGAD